MGYLLKEQVGARRSKQDQTIQFALYLVLLLTVFYSVCNIFQYTVCHFDAM